MITYVWGQIQGDPTRQRDSFEVTPLKVTANDLFDLKASSRGAIDKVVF